MRLSSTYTLAALAFGIGWAVACGGSSLDRAGTAGDSGSGGATGGVSGASGSSSGTSGSSSGTSGSSSGTSGSSSGGVSGTATGGAGGNGGSGGTTGGSAGMGGTAAVGGNAAGAGGTVAGSAGCGPCPFIACAPAVMLTVTSQSGITDLTGTFSGPTAEQVPLSCFSSGPGTPCSWYCQFTTISLVDGDYTIELNASGYDTKTVEFTIQNPTNCGCCGCVCSGGYTGEVALEPDGSALPGCCAALTETANCGACGNACESGHTCRDGECTPICLGPSAGCSDSTYPCCAGLTCCPPDSTGQPRCLETCP